MGRRTRRALQAVGAVLLLAAVLGGARVWSNRQYVVRPVEVSRAAALTQCPGLEITQEERDLMAALAALPQAAEALERAEVLTQLDRSPAQTLAAEAVPELAVTDFLSSGPGLYLDADRGRDRVIFFWHQGQVSKTVAPAGAEGPASEVYTNTENDTFEKSQSQLDLWASLFG